MRSKLTSVVLSLSLLAVAGMGQAKNRESAASSSTDVTIELHKAGDKVEIVVSSKQPLKKLSLRWLQSPRRLRLAIPGAHLAKTGRMPIDKGILQWAEAQNGPDGVTFDLASSSNPRSQISAAGDRHSLKWVASCNDIAPGEAAPTLPAGLAAEVRSAAESTPKTEKDKPKAAKTTTPGDKGKPAAVKTPTPPVAAVPKVKETPAPKNPTDVKPPKDSNPKVGDRLVSVAASGDLRTVLTSLAKAAGLQAEIDPGVQGSANMSFQEVPLNKAVSAILGQQATLYTYEISDKALRVHAPDGPGGSTVVPVGDAGSGKTASDYFPIKDKKAVEILEAVRKAVPGLTYTVDERLNQILAEGSPTDLERLRKLLQKVSVK